MIETFYGRKNMSTGILIDQLGTYLVLSTLGITVACIYSSGTASRREVAQAHHYVPAADRAGRGARADRRRISGVADRDAAPARRHAGAAGAGLGRVAAEARPVRAATGSRWRLGLGFKLVLGPLLISRWSMSAAASDGRNLAGDHI